MDREGGVMPCAAVLFPGLPVGGCGYVGGRIRGLGAGVGGGVGSGVVVIILDKRLVIYVAYRSERLIFAVPDGLHITSLNSFLHHQNLKYRNGLYVLPTRQALDAATVTITNSVPAAALSHTGGVPKRRYISLRSAGIIGNDSSSAAIIR